ncbi:amidohydrolase [Mycobacterium paraffinicum]|uniref:Amidohydrolase n=1 Tax=Mycobacterium paraffinicum TaxID=53378 RepID=A0A1Q4I2I7_9MYCO|nr:amidohydrolase family protein [Mycobacterium paraffinicum]OJZ76125.1 amidohydrolase [Mycobacterium paraffinicum]
MVDGLLDYGIFDGDTHIYDREDTFSRYLPARYADQAVHVGTDNGVWAAFVGDRKIKLLDAAFGPNGEVVKPGSLKELLRTMKSAEGETPYQWQPVEDHYIYRDARLEMMDRQGVERAFLFPSIAITIEGMYDDIDALYAQFHAFNQWYDDEWGFNYQDRIYATPYISFRDLQSAIKEVEFVIERGARAVTLRAGSGFGRSPGDPYFDPIWARLNEAKVVATYHISDAGYNKLIGPEWGQDPDPAARLQSAWQWANTYGDRPIMDTLSALIYDNVFGRFPDLRVAVVEYGAEWLPYFMGRIDKMRGMGRQGPWIGGQLKERPTAIARRHIRVVPFPEDDTRRLASQVGSDMLMMGSDYPHAEGLAEPASFVNKLEGMDPADIRRIMRDNGVELVSR